MVQTNSGYGSERPVGRRVKWGGDGFPDGSEESEKPLAPKARLLNPYASASERQDALVDFLDQLCTKESVAIASDGSAARSYRRFFGALYLGGDGFRHSYSDICHLVYDKVAPYESGRQLLSSVPPELNNLMHNLDAVIASLNALRTHARRRSQIARRASGRLELDDELYASRSEEFAREFEHFKAEANDLDEIIKRVTKLYDHVSMEVERLSYMVRQNKCNSDAILEASRTVDRAVSEKEGQLKSLSEEIERTKKDVQRDNIAVLGIFAAVVLVVNSAVGFSASSLEAIGTGRGIGPVLLMAAIVGFVVINTSGVMLSYIWRMTMGDRPQLEGWPKIAWIVTDVILGALIVFFTLTMFPWFRELVHLISIV